MPIGRQCPNNYQLPIHPEWSNLEEEKDIRRQQKEEEQEKEEEDWDGTMYNQEEQELKSDKISKSDPEAMPLFENRDTKADIPQLTDKLIGVLPISQPEEEEQMKEQCNSDDSTFFEIDSDNDSEIDNIV